MKTREYKTTIPYTPDQLDMLRWHTRESFEWKIAADGLELIDYTEADVDAASIPPKTLEMFPGHLWREFIAVAKLPDHLEALLT